MQVNEHLPLLEAMQSCLNQSQPNAALDLWRQGGSVESRETLLLVGIAHQQQENLAAAKQNYERSLALDPNYPPPQLKLAQMALNSGDYAATLIWAERYLEYRPYSPEALSWKVFALEKSGKPAEAEAALNNYIAVFPYSIASAQGSLFLAHERREYLYALLMGARIPLDKWHRSYVGQTLASCCFNLAHPSLLQATLDIAYADTSPEEDANYASLVGNVATLQHRYLDAATWYANAWKQGFPNREIHLNEALSHWAAGNFAAGYASYRERPDALKELYLEGIPEWRGESLEGKTLLVHSEQGSGDVIQFIRYMPFLREQAGAVLFNTYPDILSLLQADENTSSAQGVTEAVLDHVDYQIGMMDAPGYLRPNGIADFPAETPYLFPNSTAVSAWKQRLSNFSGLKVGLVWAGNPNHANDANRSASLAEWAALAELDGVHWFSLQKGQGEKEALYPPPGLEIQNLGPEIRDFGDTAAILANLDLLISVDTSVTHLAGACGFPCWTLLPRQNTDWRWASQAEIPQWYPSMQLIRRRKEDSRWDSLLRREVLPKLIALGARQRPQLELSSPASPEALTQIRAALAVSDLDTVLVLSEHALTENPGDPRIGLLRAEACIRSGQEDEGRELVTAALQTLPRNVHAHRLAMQLAKKSNLLQKCSHLQAMLRIDPDNHGLWQEAARFLLTHHAPMAAFLIMRHMAELAPSTSHITTLAVSLLRLGNLEVAKALTADLEPTHEDGLSTLGELYYIASMLRQPDKTQELQNLIITHSPLNSDMGLLIGTILMREGDATGWAYYNLCTWPDPAETPKQVPLWHGEPLDGKHLLLYQDQGYGDVIQFFPLLAKLPRAAKITFSVFPEVHELLKDQQLPQGMEIITHKTMESAPPNYDYRIGFMHWAAGLAPDMNKQPGAFPYLHTSTPPHLAQWEGRMRDDSNLKIGMAWAGNPQHFNDYNRSTQLGDWLPLTSIDGVSLYNLQRDQASNQVFEYPQFEFHNIVADCKSLRDTAAAISLLDLVIIVDTGPAHLSASLGTETWILLPYLGNDFRWMQDRADCPWYPSVRLFRQDANEPWSSVLERVASALSERATQNPTKH